ncbi:MAG TPA: FAD:protein FMN transferase [Candidatus Azoamicus sp. OHIO1]
MLFFLRRNFLIRVLLLFSSAIVSIFIPIRFLSTCQFKLVSHEFFLMGTYGKINVFVNNVFSGKLILKAAIFRISEIDHVMTKFDKTSDLNIINSNINLYNFMSSDLMFVLFFGRVITRMTYGYFDMGMGNFIAKLHLDSMVPIVGGIASLDNFSLELFDVIGNKVRVDRINTMLDLGGIGKGYAIDEAANVLIHGGLDHFIIEFGGDIRAFGGTPDGMPWKISMDDRLSFLFNNFGNVFYLHSGSVASSGGYLKKSVENHHIINPVDVCFDEKYHLVIVVGDSAMICDALATACYNMDYNTLLKVKDNFIGYDIRVFV